MNLTKLLLGFSLSMFFCFSITAQDSEWNADFNHKVSKSTNVTYLDLVKKIFPEAKLEKQSENESAKLMSFKSIPIRDLFNKQSAKLIENQTVELKERLLTKNGNEKLLWVIFYLNEFKEPNYYIDRNLLAVYRINKDQAEMLDAAEIYEGYTVGFGNNGWEEFSTQEKLEVLPGYESVIIHSVAGTALGEEEYSVIGLDEKGFQIILSPFYLEHNVQCGGGYLENIKFTFLKNPGLKYKSLKVTVTTYSSFEDEEEEKSKKPTKPDFLKNFNYQFVWKQSENQYVASGNHSIIDKSRRAFYRKIKSCGVG
ncbi:MAG: hypothetical protein K1X72_01150 [Pyrinomonadaceae bacterium]|nr:hypothetical protein [Pyrinomonadaceae bacterium]